MTIVEEYEFRKAYLTEHNPRMSPQGIALAIMEDRDFYDRWHHYQAYKTDPGPTRVVKQAPPSYETALAEITTIAKARGVDRETVFLERLTAAQGTPAFAALYEAYRQFHRTDGADDRDAAALAKSEPQIFSTAAAAADPRGVVSYIEDLVRTLALTLSLSDDEVMQRLKAKQPGLYGLYVEAKRTVPALPAGAPTSVDSLKMVRR